MLRQNRVAGKKIRRAPAWIEGVGLWSVAIAATGLPVAQDPGSERASLSGTRRRSIAPVGYAPDPALLRIGHV